MISKEEIRKHYIFLTEHELDEKNKMLKEYIEQLESEKENTIRKLENKIKENKERINPYKNKSNLKKIEKDYIENILIKIEVLQECLKIMKGENDE